MKIEWNKVTWYSKIAAIVVGVGIFFLGFCIGAWSERVKDQAKSISTARVVFGERV
jgi:hypothetical protein